MKPSIHLKGLLCLLAPLALAQEPTPHCDSVCTFHAGVVGGNCNAGRNPDENVPQASIDRWKATVRDKCLKACAEAPGYRDGFRVAQTVSNAIPFDCFYDWKWCTPDDETSDCTPDTPHVDVEAWLDGMICDPDSNVRNCWKRIRSGHLAGCAFRDSFDRGGAAIAWSGFRCINGLVSGTGRMEWTKPPPSAVEFKWTGELVNGYKSGFWAEWSRLDVRDDDAFEEETGEYKAGRKNGHWTRRDFLGEVSEGEYRDDSQVGIWMFTRGGELQGRVIHGDDSTQWTTHEQWNRATQSWTPVTRNRLVSGELVWENWDSDTGRWKRL